MYIKYRHSVGWIRIVTKRCRLLKTKLKHVLQVILWAIAQSGLKRREDVSCYNSESFQYWSAIRWNGISIETGAALRSSPNPSPLFDRTNAWRQAEPVETTVAARPNGKRSARDIDWFNGCVSHGNRPNISIIRDRYLCGCQKKREVQGNPRAAEWAPLEISTAIEH